MSVVVAYEEESACRRKLTVEVPQPAVEAEMGRVVGDFRRKARIPGFRSGKVPEAVIRKRYRQEIDQEVIERLMPRYWQQAQAEKSLDPLLPPEIEKVELHEGAPMTFVATVEIRPQIVIGSLDGFDLPDRPVEPSEAELQEALDELRRMRAEWKPVARPAAHGDQVVGTAVVVEGGEPQGEEHPMQVEVGGRGVPEEVTLALTGATAGREVTLRRQVGEGDDAHELVHRVTVREVRERELPELDDEFAKGFGDFASADGLRDAVRQRLVHERSATLRRDRETALLDQLRERHPLDLPERVVEREEEGLLREYAETLAARGVDLEGGQIDWQALQGQLRPQAEKRVHARLLLDAVAEHRGLKLDEREFEAFLSRLAASRQQSAFALRQELSSAGRIQSVRQQLLREQTIRHLLGDAAPDAASTAPDDGAPADEAPADE